MPYLLEFPDSELRDVIVDGGLVHLRLSAAAASNAAGERGWLTAVQLEFGNATLHGDAAHAFGKIAEARLRTDGHAVAALPVPVALAGELELALRLANGTQLVVHGATLASSSAGDARFTEDFSC